ncbi:MAG: hypothetical protein M3O70_28240 [Actinomycetota bacterium]|nr:hypothetical protein [Actinomycetota bacterium]
MKYDRSGKRVATFGSGIEQPSCIVFDKAGNAYVGQRDEIDVVKLDPRGRRLAAVDLEGAGGGGSGQFDLVPDQCALYYRRGRSIRRFDACHSRQRGSFAELRDEGGDNNGAIRILPSGGAVVADRAKIIVLDPSSKIINDHDVEGEDKWYHLALDPVGGGRFFWAAGGETGKVYRFNSSPAAVTASFRSRTSRGLPFRAAPPPTPEPPPAKTAKGEVRERDPAKTPKVEGSGAGTESDEPPNTGSLEFAAPGTSPATPVGRDVDQAVAPVSRVALAPPSRQGANLGEGQAVGGLSDVAQARTQVPARTSDTAAVSGGLGVSQLDLISAQSQAPPQPPTPPAVVAPEAAPGAPFVQAQGEPQLPGRMTSERHEGLVAQRSKGR